MASLKILQTIHSRFSKLSEFPKSNDLPVRDPILSKAPQALIRGSENMFRRVFVIVMASLAFLILIVSELVVAADSDMARSWYPVTKSELHHNPRFLLEVTDVPDRAKSQKFGENAKELCEEWFPILCKFLSTEGATQPEVVKLVIKTDLQAPGVTSGATIFINDAYITKHPHDFGMVIHELVHVAQHYPGSHKNEGWLMEGIADYLRYWKYESEKPKHKIDENAKYRDGYATTASFLAWIVWKYDRRAVRILDAALRKGDYDDALFHKITGKDLDNLWEEFVKYEQKHTE